MIRLTTVVGFFLLVFSAMGQMDTIQLKSAEVIEVKPSTNYSQESIDSLDRIQFVASELDQFLQLRSDVFIKDYGNGALSTASFRGMGSSHTQVYWNGIALNSGMNGTVDLSLYMTGIQDEVDVQYGASSMIDGAGSLGGSIKLDQKEYFGTSNHYSLMQSWSSFNTSTTQAKAIVSGKRWYMDVRLAYKRSENNFTYRNPEKEDTPTETMNNAGYEMANSVAHLGFILNSSNVIKASYNGQLSDRNLPKLNVQNVVGEYQEDRGHIALLEWRNYNAWGSNQLKVGLKQADLEYQNTNINLISISDERTYFLQDRFAYKLFNRVEGKSALLFDHSEAYNEKYGGQQTRNTVQFIHDWRLDFDNSLRTGVVFKTLVSDQNSLPCLPSVNLGYPLVDRLLDVSASVSYHGALPTMNDLFWGEGGNPNLKPEEGLSTELNFKGEWGEKLKLSYRASSYYSLIDNWILWAPESDGIWRVDNAEEVSNFGTEVTLNGLYRLKGFTLGLDLGYNYNRTENQQGEQLVYVPLQTARSRVYGEYKDFLLTYTQQWTDQRYINLSNTIWMPAYSTADLSLSYRIKAIPRLEALAMLQLLNIFDVDYQNIAHRPMPGRTYALTLKIDIE